MVIIMRIIWMFIANFFRLPRLFYGFFKLSNPKKNHTREEKYGWIHKNVKYANKGGRVIIDLTGLENLPKPSDIPLITESKSTTPETSTADSNTDTEAASAEASVTAPGYVMYANHQGLFDILSLAQEVEEPFSVISKKEVEHTPLLNRILFMLGNEFMDREDVRQSLKVIQNVTRRVKSGQNFCIFPEGTRSRNGNHLGEFKPGAFKAATMAKAPIVPVALIDSFLPFDKRSIKKVTVHVRILPPIFYEEYKDLKTPELSDIVVNRIEKSISDTLISLGRSIETE